MAITPRDRAPLNNLTAGILASGLVMAHAIQAEPLDIRPTLSVTSSAVKQVNIQGTPSQSHPDAPDRTIVTVISPGLQVTAHGAHMLIDGLIQLDSYNYVRDTQDDQIVPNGHLVAKLISQETGLGIESSWNARQVPKQFIANTGGTPNPNNDYTQTEWRIAPYLNKQLGSDTYAKAKLERRLIESRQHDETSPPASEITGASASLPKSKVTTASASIEQRAIPFGYELSLRRQKTDTQQFVKNTTAEHENELSQVYTETTHSAKGLYALLPDLDIGLLIGHEAYDLRLPNELHSSAPVNPNSFYSGRIYGWSVDWRPQERTSFAAQVEHHPSGQGSQFLPMTWQVDASQRMSWLVFGMTFSRHAAPPTPSDPAKYLNDAGSIPAVLPASHASKVSYSLAAQLRKESSGRIAFVGRRDTIIFAAGRIDTTPLTQEQSFLPTASTTRDYFFSGDWSHQLAPNWQVVNGLKWTRSHLTLQAKTSGSSYVFGRDFFWRGALITDLSPSAAASFGFRRKIGHTNTISVDGSKSPDEGVETAAFVGLDYKF